SRPWRLPAAPNWRPAGGDIDADDLPAVAAPRQQWRAAGAARTGAIMGEERAAIERPRKSDHMALGSGEQELRPVLVVAGERERRSRAPRFPAPPLLPHARWECLAPVYPPPS